MLVHSSFKHYCSRLVARQLRGSAERRTLALQKLDRLREHIHMHQLHPLNTWNGNNTRTPINYNPNNVHAHNNNPCSLDEK